MIPTRARPARRAAFAFTAPGAAPVTVELALPRSLGPQTRLVLVMHGVLRNAGEYRDAWLHWAGATDHLVACPCFAGRGWRGARAYTLGGVFTGRDGTGSRRPEARWSFTVVEALAAHVRGRYALEDPEFDLWGHSAGALFVHRLPLFRPDAPVRRLLAANAGWYTVPDAAIAFPYGLRHPALEFTPQDVRRWLAAPLVLMRGEEDRARDEHLRTTAGADRQGPTRHARAAHALERARAADPGTRWRLADVRGAGHDFLPMARAAQREWARLAPRGDARPA